MLEMMVYEPDPDVVRWNLHLLDVCSLPRGSPQMATHYDKDSSQTEYVREGHWERTYNNVENDDLTVYGSQEGCNVENDEIIAHAFQEELSRLAVAEASGSSHTEAELQNAYILSQDWVGSSRTYCNSDHQNNQEEAEERELVENCKPKEIEIDLEIPMNFMEIADESSLEGEVGKRMNQMVAVPHIPKINGEIPSVDEATSDHQRLLERLELYDLVELKVSGDGNCQFRSLSDQIYRTTEYHKFVREQVVNQLKGHHELYEGYVPMEYDNYVKKMSRSGEWGDHVTLQAAADVYGIKIFVLTSFKDTCYIEILPQAQKSQKTIFLSFWAEVHYNSIYPEGDLPTLETKKKKKWWWPGSGQ